MITYSKHQIAEVRQTWNAMRKFASGEPLTEREWEALSWLTLVDRNRLEFAPGNVRWVESEAERIENLAFYKSLGAVSIQ